jgi:hypothetical protein
MNATLAIISLGLLLCVSFVQFANELYYSRRVSALGAIVLMSSLYLMWYLHHLNGDLINLTLELGKYQPVIIPKGE